jgi:hypothetical protein
MGEGFGTFLGPLLAGLLVAATGSTAASLIIAGAFAGAAAAATGISFEYSADARGGAAAVEPAYKRLKSAPTVFRRYPGATIVIADFVAQIFVRGLLITLIVVASIEVLDMGDTGVGLLNAAVGLGGLLGAIAALGVGGGRRLPAIFVVALVCWGLPLILIGAWAVPAIALSALFVTGISNALLDISGFTLIQRGVSNEDRMTVFAVFEGLLGVGLLIGSLLAPAVVAAFGARGGFVVAGAILPLLAVATARPILRLFAGRALAAEQLELLRRNPLFAPLPLTALDRLAESLVPTTLEPGEVAMREGETGEHYLLIEHGEVDVTASGRLLRACGPGDGVGEIALIRRIARTATVTARTPVKAYTIDAESFLLAVAGPAAAAMAETIISTRLLNSEQVEAVT